MNSKDYKLSKIVNKVIGIMQNENLPYTYNEVFEVVHHFNGNMEEISEFINGYKNHLAM